MTTTRRLGKYHSMAVQQRFGKYSGGYSVYDLFKDGKKVENNVDVVQDCMSFIRIYQLKNRTVIAQIEKQLDLRNSFFDINEKFYHYTILSYLTEMNICRTLLSIPLPGWLNHQLEWMGQENYQTMVDLFEYGRHEKISRLVYSKLVELKNDDENTFDRASRDVRKLCSAAYKYSLDSINLQKFEKARRLGFENAAFEFFGEVRNDLLARNDNTPMALQLCRLLHQMDLPIERNSTREFLLLFEVLEIVQKDQQANEFMRQRFERTDPIDIGNYTSTLVEFLETTNTTDTYSLAEELFDFLVKVISRKLEQTDFSCITNDNVWVKMLQKISTNESCHEVSSIPKLQIAVDKTLDPNIKMIKTILVASYRIVCENKYNYLVDKNRIHIGNYYHRFEKPEIHWWPKFNSTEFESLLNTEGNFESLFI